jgi:hypothetical protein
MSHMLANGENTHSNVQYECEINVDGSINTNGDINEKCLITFRSSDKEMTEWFYVTATGDQNLILGLPWLKNRNPIIDWREETLEFRTSPGDSKLCESRLTAKL